MEYTQLPNGIRMPMIGYGTYQTPPAVTEHYVTQALQTGYRSIDTAQCYGNEQEVGLACRRSGIPREELFVTTKLWACQAYSDAVRSIQGSQKRLDLGYIDLLLIHEPTGNVPEIYRAMEDAYEAGTVRAIGVSNVMPDIYLQLIRSCRIIPAVNQVETHVFRQQRELRDLEKKYGTVPESWSPLASGKNNIFSNSVMKEIARARGKSISQIALRFLIEEGIVVIPKSLSRSHMEENLEIFDFSLTSEEMRRIESLDTGRSLFNWW